MREIPQALAQHLAGGATTLCQCWRVALASGEVMGFTDHDRALAFDGVTYEAETGFAATEIESALGLSVDNLEASGALSSPRLSEARLAAGEFDNAAVELWRVNWQDTDQRVLLKRGNVGEVTRGRGFFAAELRGLSHVLNQPRGRLFQYGCDAVLGDQRCGVDLASPAFSAMAQVNSCRERRVLVLSGIAGFAAGFFANGTARFTDGPNAGLTGHIKFHRLPGGIATIELWQALAADARPGDGVSLQAGCDRQFATCRAKFGNGANFRGFPHMPGDDFVMAYAVKKKKSKGKG